MNSLCRNVIFSVLCIQYLSTQANTDSNSESSTLNTKPEILKEWIEMDKDFKSLSRSLIKYLMPMIVKSTSDLNLTSQCVQQSFQLISGLRNLKKWAFSSIDSSGKMLDGVLSGSVTSLGAYDQCLDTIVTHSTNSDTVLFQGQYCSFRMRPPLPPKTKQHHLHSKLEELKNFTGSELVTHIASMGHFFYYYPYTVGICVPSGCTENDVSQLLTLVKKNLHFVAELNRCQVKKSTKFDKMHIFVIILCTCLSSIVLVGSGMELLADQKKYQSTGWRILRSFSVITNFKKFTSTKTSEDSLRCLYGFRFLGITWMIIGHVYYRRLSRHMYQLLVQVRDLLTTPAALTISNSTTVVASFLFLGGLLTCYLTVKYVKFQNHKFNYFKYVVHRFWRIAPVYYFVVVFSMLTPLMGSGPEFEERMEKTIYKCYKYWWRNFLFINNLFNIHDICHLHTWYLSCDFQLYLVAPIAILPLIRSEKIGLAINLIIILISTICSAVSAYLFDFNAMVMLTIDPEQENTSFLYIYASPFYRAIPYFIGVLVGYIIATRSSLKIPKKFLCIGWCLATISCASVIYGPIVWFEHHVPSKLGTIMYLTFYQMAWSAGIGWMIVCCATSQGGFINEILSWKVWVPLSKLGFLIYVIHFIVLNTYLGVFKTTQEFTHIHLVMEFFGCLCISGLLALLCNLLIESPFLAIEKILLQKDFKSADAKVESNGKILNTNLELEINGKSKIDSSKMSYENENYVREL